MKIINNVMKFTLWVWFCTLSLSCTKEIYRFNDSPDMFEVRKLGAYINRPIKELLDSLIHQKGMPQRILVYDKPIEWYKINSNIKIRKKIVDF